MSFSTPSHLTGKFRAHVPARFVLAFFHVLCLVNVFYNSFSVALSQVEPSEDLPDTIASLTPKKKGALPPQEASSYDDITHASDKARTPPPSASSSGVYLEDM